MSKNRLIEIGGLILSNCLKMYEHKIRLAL
jgi:hypothetical protein